MQVDLEIIEISVLIEDLETDLKSTHIGGGGCKDVSKCPFEHFDMVPDDQIARRQGLLRKLRAVQGRKGSKRAE